jgi:hypothetical protein
VGRTWLGPRARRDVVGVLLGVGGTDHKECHRGAASTSKFVGEVEAPRPETLGGLPSWPRGKAAVASSCSWKGMRGNSTSSTGTHHPDRLQQQPDGGAAAEGLSMENSGRETYHAGDMGEEPNHSLDAVVVDRRRPVA